MGTSCGVDKLPSDPHPASGLADTAFENVADSKLSPDLLHIDGPAFEGEARIAGDDEEPAHPRQSGDDLLGHAVSEVFLFAVAAQVIEWEDSDGRLVR